MSVLNSLFNRASFGVRCKTCLNLAISRMKLLRNKREAQLKQMQKEIAQYLQTGQEAIARIRVEHIVREQNILAAYDILELFCEFVLARVPILDAQKDCPTELQEAVASIIFASPRCSDLPELLQIRNLFNVKYGKEFVAAASELRPDSSVNRMIIEKLSVGAPAADVKIKVLKSIAKEYNLEWNSSLTEAELGKKHEDLLDGLKPSFSNGGNKQSAVDTSLTRDLASLSVTESNRRTQPPDTSNSLASSASIVPKVNTKVDDSIQKEELHFNGNSAVIRSSDALESARAAIAASERACAAARAAAQLVNARTASQANSSGVHS